MSDEVKRFRASERGYVDGRIVEEGEAFATAAPAGSWMAEIDEAEFATVRASTTRGDDPALEALPLSALQGYAAERKVAFQGLNKARLIEAIRAVQAPTA